MRIGFLIPHIYASSVFKDRIFAPLNIGLELVDGLVEKGHEVFLYSSGDVKTRAKVIPGPKRASDEDLEYYQFRNRTESDKKIITLEAKKRFFEDSLTLKAYEDYRMGKLDIIHSFHDFDAHFFNDLTNYPTLYTLHDPLPQNKDTFEFIRYSAFPNHNYISISNSQRKGAIDLNFLETIYHGLKLNDYEFNDNPEDYIVYLGRLLKDKGVDLAVHTALGTNTKLKIATSSDPSNRDEEYYENKIKPFVDGEKVEIVGFVSGKEKSDFIRKAKAFIFPLQWDEPFGLTIIESMACGTPVIAFDRGSVPELVENGKTGFVIPQEEGVEGLKSALSRIDEVNREDCRKHVEENFTVEKMVENYEKVYEKIINQNKS